jgi:hypothetical protein
VLAGAGQALHAKIRDRMRAEDDPDAVRAETAYAALARALDQVA